MDMVAHRKEFRHELKDMLTERQRDLSFDILIENGAYEYLIMEILSWLPVKALLQFKSVCKLWYSIITSSYFISKHLRNYYYNDNNWRDCLIVQYFKNFIFFVDQTPEFSVCKLLVDAKYKEVSSYQSMKTPIDDKYMCGPCDGIYFLWNFYSDTYQALWNPALNEFELLPTIISKPNLPSYMKPSAKAYGFGIDSRTTDYKVIVIHGHWDNKNDGSYMDNPLSVFIYSLKSNSWNYWGDMKNSYFLPICKSATFVNGCCYWLGSRMAPGWKDWNCEVVISFDIRANSYEEIRLPKFEKEPYNGSQLIVYHESLAFVYVPSCATYFSIWSWNERVWACKLVVEVGFDRQAGAISHWRDNLLVFSKTGGELVLYETDTSKMYVLDHPKDISFQDVIVYKESLVSITKFITEAHHK